MTIKTNNRRDSIVQEREAAEPVAFDASRLPRLAEEPARIDHAARFREQLNAEEIAPEPEAFPSPPAPRAIAPIDLSEFRDLRVRLNAAQERVAGCQQALQDAQRDALLLQGACEGEYARIMRRYGIGKGESFTLDTGAIVAVQQG